MGSVLWRPAIFIAVSVLATQPACAQTASSQASADEAHVHKPDDASSSKLMAAKKSAEEVKDGFGDAVTAPLTDLNLKREAIPDILIKAAANAYDMTGMAHCESIGQEIALLDTAIGLDFDQASEARRRDIAERGGEFASQTALSTVKGAAESIIPVRGLVREVTGAEKHQKAIDHAITAGRVRRGFLKG
ncbi:MAG: hypothetical protein B7Z26_04500, partial [Asticcacaulis sp. 32-58-5]